MRRTERWRQGFAEESVEDLLCDKTRTPDTPPHSTRIVAEMLPLTYSEPLNEVADWTGRTIPKYVGISMCAEQRILEVHGLPPHRLRTFTRSHDPAFAEKVGDVGLYMNPTAHVVVLSIQEKPHPGPEANPPR